MNKIILLGRLTKDVEIKYSQNTNTKVALFTLAVNRNFVKQGEERKADFINIVAYSKLADFAEKYLQTGLQICLSGRLQIRNYEDNTGTKRYIAEVIAEEINFADGPRKTSEQILCSPTSVRNQETNNNEEFELVSDDDLPF